MISTNNKGIYEYCKKYINHGTKLSKKMIVKNLSITKILLEQIFELQKSNLLQELNN